MLFFKHKTAYEMRSSDWSSDVCSSDLLVIATGAYLSWSDLGYFILGCYTIIPPLILPHFPPFISAADRALPWYERYITKASLFNVIISKIGRASCRERVCQFV